MGAETPKFSSLQEREDERTERKTQECREWGLHIWPAVTVDYTPVSAVVRMRLC